MANKLAILKDTYLIFTPLRRGATMPALNVGTLPNSPHRCAANLTCHQNENTMFKPELLSPAGTLKNMRYAFAYGADAVYAGQPRYSLRVRNNEFNHENLQLGINEAHALGKNSMWWSTSPRITPS